MTKQFDNSLSLKLLIMFISLKRNKFYLMAKISDLITPRFVLYAPKLITTATCKKDSFDGTPEQVDVLRYIIKQSVIFKFSPLIFFSLSLVVLQQNYLTKETQRKLTFLYLKTLSKKKRYFINSLFCQHLGHLYFSEIQKLKMSQYLITHYFELPQSQVIASTDYQNFTLPHLVYLISKFTILHEKPTHFLFSWDWLSSKFVNPSKLLTFMGISSKSELSRELSSEFFIPHEGDTVLPNSVMGHSSVLLLFTDNAYFETSIPTLRVAMLDGVDETFSSLYQNYEISEHPLQQDNLQVDIGEYWLPDDILDEQRFNKRLKTTASAKKNRLFARNIVYNSRIDRFFRGKVRHLKKTIKQLKTPLWKRTKRQQELVPNDWINQDLGLDYYPADDLNGEELYTQPDIFSEIFTRGLFSGGIVEYTAIWNWKQFFLYSVPSQSNLLRTSVSELRLDLPRFFNLTKAHSFLKQNQEAVALQYKAFALDAKYIDSLYIQFSGKFSNVSFFDVVPFCVLQQIVSAATFSNVENIRLQSNVVALGSAIARPHFFLNRQDYFGQLKKDLSDFYCDSFQDSIKSSLSLFSNLVVQTWPSTNILVLKNSWNTWSISRQENVSNYYYFYHHPLNNEFQCVLYKLYSKRLLFDLIFQQKSVIGFDLWQTESPFELQSKIKKLVVLDLFFDYIDLAEDLVGAKFTRLHVGDFGNTDSLQYSTMLFQLQSPYVPTLARKFLANSTMLYDWHYNNFYNALWQDFVKTKARDLYDPRMRGVSAEIRKKYPQEFWAELSKSTIKLNREYSHQHSRAALRRKASFVNFSAAIPEHFFHFPDRFPLHKGDSRQIASFVEDSDFLSVTKDSTRLWSLLQPFLAARTQAKIELVQKSKNKKSSQQGVMQQVSTSPEFVCAQLNYGSYFETFGSITALPHESSSNLFVTQYLQAVPSKFFSTVGGLSLFSMNLSTNTKIMDWLAADSKYFLLSIINTFLKKKSFDHQQLSKFYLFSITSTPRSFISPKLSQQTLDCLDLFLQENFKQLVFCTKDQTSLQNLLQLLMYTFSYSSVLSKVKKFQLGELINQLFFFRDIIHLCGEPLGEFWYSFFETLHSIEQMALSTGFRSTQIGQSSYFISYESFLYQCLNNEVLAGQGISSSVISSVRTHRLNAYFTSLLLFPNNLTNALTTSFSFFSYQTVKSCDAKCIEQFLQTFDNLLTDRLFWYFSTYYNLQQAWSLQCKYFLYQQSLGAIFLHQQFSLLYYQHVFQYFLTIFFCSVISAVLLFLFVQSSSKVLLACLAFFCSSQVLFYFYMRATIRERFDLNNPRWQNFIKRMNTEDHLLSPKQRKRNATPLLTETENEAAMVRQVAKTFNFYLYCLVTDEVVGDITFAGLYRMSDIHFANGVVYRVNQIRASKPEVFALPGEQSQAIHESNDLGAVRKFGQVYWGMPLFLDKANRNPLFYVRMLSAEFWWWKTFKVKWDWLKQKIGNFIML